jgi:hypothetical protein
VPTPPDDPRRAAAAAQRVSGALLLVALLQFVLAGLMLLGGPQSGPQQAAPGPGPGPVMAPHILAAAVALIGIWALSRYRPYPAALAALGLFVAMWVVDVTIFKMSLHQGIPFRIVMLVAIVTALRAAREHRDLTSPPSE